MAGRVLSTTSGLGAYILSAGTVNEPYTLPSGAVIDSYFDEYRVAADPELLAEVGAVLADLLPADAEVLAGVELGGVPFALAVSAAARLPVVLVRKSVKPYGTRRQVEGQPITGRRIVMIDDVVRSGRQILTAAAALRAAGGQPTAAVAVLTRPGQAAAVVAAHEISLTSALHATDTPSSRAEVGS